MDKIQIIFHQEDNKLSNHLINCNQDNLKIHQKLVKKVKCIKTHRLMLIFIIKTSLIMGKLNSSMAIKLFKLLKIKKYLMLIRNMSLIRQ